MANLIVTGHQGEEHVSAVDARNFHVGLMGDGNYVFENNNQFKAVVQNANSVRIYSGDGIMQGTHFRLGDGEYVDLTIENGTSEYYRNDLIVARYSKDATTTIETVEFVVITGTSSADAASDPDYNTGDLQNGEALKYDFPLWRIPLDGLTVGTPEQLFTVWTPGTRVSYTLSGTTLSITTL